MAKRKQITFDIDTNVAKEILGEKKYTNVYAHIRRFMTKNKWEHIEGSVYMSNKPMDNSDILFLIKDMKKQYPYLDKCIKEMHQSDISKVHSLQDYFEYDGTPGKYAQLYEQKDNSNQKAKPSVIGKLAENKAIVEARDSEHADQPVKAHEKSEHSER